MNKEAALATVKDPALRKAIRQAWNASERHQAPIITCCCGHTGKAYKDFERGGYWACVNCGMIKWNGEERPTHLFPFSF